MQNSIVRFCLLEWRGIEVAHRKLDVGQLMQKGFYRRMSVKADPKVLALRAKLLYCDYLDREMSRLGYVKRLRLRKLLENQKSNEKNTHQPVYSVMLTDRREKSGSDDSAESIVELDAMKPKPVHMPYARCDSFEMTDSATDNGFEETDSSLLDEAYKTLRGKNLAEQGQRCKHGEKELQEPTVKGELWKIPATWMSDYEQFDDSLLSMAWYNSYGTPSPRAKVSSVPCGGCGSLLHCRDPAIPGYLPSELFLRKNVDDLKAMICQRCHFLKFYNASLDVRVSIEDYPKLLSKIKQRKCAVILIIDLTDFPCSIWPELKSILHPFTPVFLVGNKVDLLPRDSPLFFEKTKQLLADTVVNVTGVKRENITHVQLTSAKTGFGIEQLINKLHFKWGHRGDVYLVGCTNVGKSSLFNTLLNSDYCKVQAVDLVQRATVSVWPGTTLNLLKFPILNLTGKKLWRRVQRLKREDMHRRLAQSYRDHRFRDTLDLKLATLEDDVGKTFSGVSSKDEVTDPFSEGSVAVMEKQPVLDESRPEYEYSRWCYDTPGTIQQEQVLDLLTTDELLLTLPQTIISPRTLVLKQGQTVFLAGLARLDYLDGENFIRYLVSSQQGSICNRVYNLMEIIDFCVLTRKNRCTLFASEELPITVCYTSDADELYPKLLESEAFGVPRNDPERLNVWPELEWKTLKVIGVKHGSAADVVLSSSGWIAVTAHEDENVHLRAWTPQGRGIHLRCPALLSKSVYLCGPKVQGTPMYLPGRQVYARRM